MTKSVAYRPVATINLLWVRKDGSEVSVIGQIGEPYQLDELSWACPAELKGVDPQYPDIQGGSAMQAVCLAIRLIKTRLGHLLDDDECIYEVENLTEKLDKAYLDIVFAS